MDILGERSRLKAGVVPSVFTYKRSCETSSQSARKKRAAKRELLAGLAEQCPLDIAAEVTVEDTATDAITTITRGTEDQECQCQLVSKSTARWSIENFVSDAASVQYYTGFDDYEHFQFLFALLGPAASNLTYQCSHLSPQDQLFLTLMKLRQAKDNQELALFFKISMSTVSSVFNTWVNFLYFQLQEIDFWPSREVVNEHMPKHFGELFKNTRVILDATEIPVQKPSKVDDQSATFSTYKNRNTLKAMIGCTPRGLISYVSTSYGGCSSDRQIIERSPLISEEGLFETGDSIMADRGIMVQDLFACKNVHVNTPTMLKGKHQLEPETVVKDRRIASKRIHVERVIGLSKTFKILQRNLSAHYVPLGGRIVYVCFMLSNFRRSIVNRLA